MTETVALSVYHMAANFRAIGYKSKILAITYPPSAYTARMVSTLITHPSKILQLSKFRPPTNVITISQDLRVAREINLLWGVRSVYVEELESAGDLEHRNLISIAHMQKLSLLGSDVSFFSSQLGLTKLGSCHLCFSFVVG